MPDQIRTTKHRLPELAGTDLKGTSSMFTQTRSLAATGTTPAVSLMTSCANIVPVPIDVRPVYVAGFALPMQSDQGLALNGHRWETKPAPPGGPSYTS